MRLLSKVIKASQAGLLPDAVFGGIALPVVAGAAEEDQHRAALEQAFRKAKQIVDSAQSYRMEQMRDCAARTAKETEEAKKRGYDEGFAQGHEEGKKDGMQAGLREGGTEGRKQAAAENRKYLDEMVRMIEAVERSKTDVLTRFESDLTDLAMTIARAIIKKELETDPQAMRSIIQSAMDSYRNQAWVRVYVSDKTANRLLKADKKIADELKEISDNVKVVVTAGMNDGACVLEMPDQVIDAGVDTQLKKIRTALNEAVRSEAQ